MRKSDPYSARTQATFILLAASFELKRSRTKCEVIAVIEHNQWFNIEAEDKIPYDSQPTEPRWKTAIAWCRKNCVSTNPKLMESDIQDCWIATKEGLNIIAEMKKVCAEGGYDVGQCYLWSSALKTYFNPEFSPSLNDKTRPQFMYRDSFQMMLKGPKGADLIKKLCGGDTK